MLKNVAVSVDGNVSGTSIANVKATAQSATSTAPARSPSRRASAAPSDPRLSMIETVT